MAGSAKHRGDEKLALYPAAAAVLALDAALDVKLLHGLRLLAEACRGDGQLHGVREVAIVVGGGDFASALGHAVKVSGISRAARDAVLLRAQHGT
jgi:hypothetical protein